MSVSVRIRVEVEIDSGSSWSDDCPMSQLSGQAVREAMTRLKNVFADAKVAVKIHGEPQPIFVQVIPEKKT